MDIWQAIGLDMARRRCIALVGGGGKTTLIHALARQARDAGCTVVITTTTHIVPHPGIFLTEELDGRLGELLESHGVITLGRWEQPDKLSGVGGIAACKAAADVVLVEADGARLHPLKAPADYEPVIPSCADAVLAVAGLDSLGEPIGTICHRPELVCALLDKPMDWRITPGDVAELLSSPTGGRKGVTAHMDFRCVLNKADTLQREEAAAEIKQALASRGVPAGVTKFTEEERGGLCWF